MKKIVLLAALFWGTSSYAFYEVLDTGNIVPKGSYKTYFAPQFILNQDKGLNITGALDFGFNDYSNFRAVLGAGTTDFYTSLFFKWIPIPDLESQPAVGFTTGLTYATSDSFGNFNLHFRPLISETWESDFGLFTPYASVPLSYSNLDGKSEYPIQLVLGTEFKHRDSNYVTFFTEIGFDLSHAFSYLSFAVALQFDEENGVRIE